MVSAVVGALIGTMVTGTTAGVASAWIFGSTLWASVIAGALIGASFGGLLDAVNFDTTSSSPTYAFGPVSNSKTQKLPIPVIYGGPVRVAGNIFYEKFLDDSCKVVDRYIGISAGPIQSIVDVKGGDELLVGLEGCSVSIYLNTDSSTHDDRDPKGEGAKRPYPNDLAFIATTLTAQEKLNGNSVITSICEGKLVWTPINPLVYSRDPAWIIYDILTDKLNGIGIPKDAIDLDSFKEASDYYSEIVHNPLTGTDGPRFFLARIIDTQDTSIDILAEFLSACRSYLVARDKIRLVVDKPVNTFYKKVGPAQIIDGSFSYWQKAEEEILNRVVIEWTDPEDSYEQVVTIFDDEEDQEKRGIYEQSYSLTSIIDKAVAARMGAYLIDSAQNIIDYCAFQVSLKDADIEAGDVIAVTHDLPGWVDKWMRVLIVTDNNADDEYIELSCAEYIPEIYDDIPLNVPTHIDTTIDNPFVASVKDFRAYVLWGSTYFVWRKVEQTFMKIAGYEIRRGEQWHSGQTISRILGVDTVRYGIGEMDIKPTTYWICAVSDNGLYSSVPTSYTIDPSMNPSWDSIPVLSDAITTATLENAFVFQGAIYQDGGDGWYDLPLELIDWFLATRDSVVTAEQIDLNKEVAGFVKADVIWRDIPGYPATYETRTSNNDGQWTDWMEETTAAMIQMRYVQSRIKMVLSERNIGSITMFRVLLSLPDQTNRYNDVVIAPEGTRVDFIPPFVKPPAIAIQQHGNGVIIPEIQNLTFDGVTIKLQNSSGQYISGTVEVIVNGF